MAPGKISKLQKPTGSVENSRSQKKPTRQSARILERANPQISNVDIDEDAHEDVHNTSFQNVKRVFKSCVEKVTKKTINKRSTKKASNTEIVKKVQRMLGNELLSTFDEQASIEGESSSSRIDNTGGSVDALTCYNAGEFQDHSGDFLNAESVTESLNPHALQLNPGHEFRSPHHLANVFAQVKELDTARETNFLAPSAPDQQIDPIQEFVSSLLPQIQPIDTALDFGLASPSAHDQYYNPSPGFDSPSRFDYTHPYDSSLVFDLSVSYAHLPNLASAFEFGSPTSSAHVPDLISASEFDSLASSDYSQPYHYRLDSVPPECSKYSQLHDDVASSEVSARIAEVGVLDPRLLATPILEIEDQEYDLVTEAGFPANYYRPNYVHHPESSFPLASNQAGQYGYQYSQTNMSATSPHSQTESVIGTLSPAVFRHQLNKDNNGLNEDGICAHSLNGYGLPTITPGQNCYHGNEATTCNGLGVHPAIIKSTGIELGLSTVHRQQGIAHNEKNANNWGYDNVASAHYILEPWTIEISEQGTKPESESAGSGTKRRIGADCSVEAAEKGLWHTAMNKLGIYRPRGMILVLGNGTMQWREHSKARWCNAIKHSSIRGQLLAESAKLGQYTYPREKGQAAEDITAFHPDQKDWAFEERNLRPDILHQYEKRGYQNPSYPVQIWLHDGAVVLDHQNQPILDFKNMPKTISSQVEGGLQEAITRQDSRVDVNDFRVRMPFDPKGQGAMSTPCLSAISMRRSRFRWRAGYLSWTPRTGSEDLKLYLDSILPAHCKAANSTKGFRELKASEVKRMTLENRGKHLSRAGLRKLSPAAREKSERTFRRSLRKSEMKEAGIRVGESGERKEDGDEGMANSPTEAQSPARVGLNQGLGPHHPTKPGRREWMRDMGDDELEEHRKKILPIFAPDRESWEDLDGLQKFTVDSWADLEAVGVISYDDSNKPVPDYGVIRQLIKHILDGKRVSEYYLFREYDENAARLLG